MVKNAKGFWKSSGGTENMDARFHFCAHWRYSAFRPWALFE
jgi:hypothetical protein